MKKFPQKKSGKNAKKVGKETTTQKTLGDNGYNNSITETELEEKGEKTAFQKNTVVQETEDNNGWETEFTEELKRISTDYEFILEELFYRASDIGAIEILKMLINNVNISMQMNIDRKYPMRIACQKGYLNVVNYLISLNDFDINEDIRVNQGENPIDDISYLSIACKNNHEDIAVILINNGADVNNSLSDIVKKDMTRAFELIMNKRN